MLKKTLYFLLFILVAEELVLTTGNDTETGETLSQLAEQLKPFVSLARSVADQVGDSANIASSIIPKMAAAGVKLKDGTADSKLKTSTADDLLNFCDKSKNVLKEMNKMISGGSKLMDQFIAFANELKRS